MKKLNEIKTVYFLGIGGIGMSALARYFKAMGAQVGGYDRTPTALTDELAKEGMEIIFEDDVNKMPKEVDLVVYTPAIPANHQGLNFYRDNNYELRKRSEVLGIISADKFTIAVAGSHGKTTVSAMIAHILTHSEFGCSAFLGGIAVNYNANFIQGYNDVVVIEADEFDRSFHRLAPDMAVITAVDTDHLDIYGTKEAIDEAFITFAEKIAEDGFLVIKNEQSIQDKLPVLDKAFYSLNDENADVFCSKYWVTDGGYLFSLSYYGKVSTGWRLNIGGFHNIENAIAAITIAKELKITDEKIKSALASFKGIKRRFEKLVDKPSVVYIDDYAHHPEEIRVLLESVIEIYPDRKITAIFQPHLFSRTRDLASEFAQALSLVDEVVLLDIYPARELPMEGVTSALIFDEINTAEKVMVSKDEVLAYLSNRPLDLVLTIGAGDIDKLVSPLATMLSAR